ncbi:MAG TPA: EAL domain-containing protein [Patescibacteria group bacterium]|nr:EAL domain-containing protein [Patescibacteria group bacterium]
MIAQSLAADALLGNAEHGTAVERILAMARSHLDMDVAFVSEWIDGQQVFRHLDGMNETFDMRVDSQGPLEGSYCIRVMDGRLPNFVGDAAGHPEVKDLEATRDLKIGSYIGVPVRFSDGRFFGMLCCVSHTMEPTLNPRDVRFMEMLASLVADRLEADRAEQSGRHEVEDRVRATLDGAEFDSYLQPIVRLADRSVVGFEALTRFRGAHARTPDVWFAEATSVGLGIELELAAARLALRSLRRLPAEAYLSLNFSPSTVVDPRLAALLRNEPAERIVLEVTEHDAVEDYPSLERTLKSLRSRGLRLAIDDAGAGFSSFRHVIQLAPDIIKADVALTRGIDRDPARQALTRSLARFAQETGAIIVSEGIETDAELRMAARLGVSLGQGYLLGRPAPAHTHFLIGHAPFRRTKGATSLGVFTSR